MPRIGLVAVEPGERKLIPPLEGHSMQLLGESEEPPDDLDLILVVMGRRVAAAEEICRRFGERHPMLPLVVASCLQDPMDAHRLVAAGARDHILLPCDAADLGFRLSAHVKWARLAGPAPEPSQSTWADMSAAVAFAVRLPLPVVASDRKGRFLFANRAGEDLLGVSASTLLAHHHVTDFFARPELARRVMESVGEADPGSMAGVDIEIRTAAGRLVPVRLHVMGVEGPDGAVVSTVGLCVVRTEEVMLQERLEETTRQLIEAEMRAGTADRWHELAHELNQPLTVAMGTIEMMGTFEDLSGELVSRTTKVYDQLQRIAAIIRQVP